MTVQEAIDQAQVTYRDMTDAQGLVYAQKHHTWLCVEFPLIRATETFNAMVADQLEYTYSNRITSIRAVEWFQTSTEHWPLTATHPDVLDQESAGWRYDDSSEPRQFYHDAGKIGFVPAPDTASSGGYPKAIVEEYVTSTLALDTALPTVILDHNIYVEAIRMEWSKTRDKDNLAYWKSLFDEHVRTLELAMGRINRRFRPTTYPEGYSVGTI